MSAHTPEEIQKEVSRYIKVFIVLIIGTILTVAASYIELPNMAMTVGLALFIASVKGFFVAGYFMHLMDERKMIYGIMASTVFFAVGLMFLTIWAMSDPPTNTIYP